MKRGNVASQSRPLRSRVPIGPRPVAFACPPRRNRALSRASVTVSLSSGTGTYVPNVRWISSGFVQEHIEHNAVHGAVGAKVSDRLDDLGVLAIAVYAALALLQAVGVPGKVIVKHGIESMLEVDAFAKAIGGHEHPAGLVGEFVRSCAAFVVAHPARDRNAPAHWGVRAAVPSATLRPSGLRWRCSGTKRWDAVPRAASHRPIRRIAPAWYRPGNPAVPFARRPRSRSRRRSASPSVASAASTGGVGWSSSVRSSDDSKTKERKSGSSSLPAIASWRDSNAATAAAGLDITHRNKASAPQYRTR